MVVDVPVAEIPEVAGIQVAAHVLPVAADIPVAVAVDTLAAAANGIDKQASSNRSPIQQ